MKAGMKDRGYKAALKWLNDMRRQDGFPPMDTLPSDYLPEEEYMYLCRWNPGGQHSLPCDKDCLGRYSLFKRFALFICDWWRVRQFFQRLIGRYEGPWLVLSMYGVKPTEALTPLQVLDLLISLYGGGYRSADIDFIEAFCVDLAHKGLLDRVAADSYKLSTEGARALNNGERG